MLRGVTGRFWTGMVSLAALLCLGASPSPRNVALEYAAPPGCPVEASFREWVADMYEFKDPFVPKDAAGTFTFHVSIEKVETTYLGTMLALNADGTVRTRSVDRNDNCDALVYEVAHGVRLLVLPAPSPAPPPAPARDPDEERKLWRRLDQLEEANEARDEQIKQLLKRIDKLEEDLEDEKRKMNLTYSVFTGALLSANLTSNVGPGFWVGGDLRIDPISIGLEFRAVLPSQVVVGPYDLDLSQFVGLLTPCGRYSIFFGCAVAGAGAQIDHDSNFHPSVPTTGSSALVQLGGRIGVEVPLGDSRFAIRGWGEVLYSTPSVGFTYGEGSTVTASVDRPDVSAFFGLGLVVRLGDEQEGAK